MAKTVDTLRNLLNNDPGKLAQHILVNERPVDDYLLHGWKWNEGRYGVQRGLREMLEVLSKVSLPSSLRGLRDIDEWTWWRKWLQLIMLWRRSFRVIISQRARCSRCNERRRTSHGCLCISTYWTYISRGNLSVRSLVDIVKKEYFIDDSEYMETKLVAVPKWVPHCLNLS